MSEAEPRREVGADDESGHPAPESAADAERMRRNPFAVTLLLIAGVSLLIGGALVVTGAALEHLVRPPDVLAGASFSSASTPWLFVGAIAALLWLAVAAVRWHVDDRQR